MAKPYRISCLFAGLCLLAANLLAQANSSTITADVTDPIGAIVPRATVTAPNEGTKASVHSYSTTFRGTENPISENGNWLEGHASGANLWGNVETVSGAAYGADEPTPFGDPTAILAGTWGPTQTATATVKIDHASINKCCHEVELRLRTTISDHSITGYEAYCSVTPIESPYCHIARWNGPNGSYWNFETGSSTLYVKDGDVMKATVTGTNPVIITLYVNGVQILQATDTGAAGGGFGAYGPWTTGNPGIGFFDNYDNDWKAFGLSSFSVTDELPQPNR